MSDNEQRTMMTRDSNSKAGSDLKRQALFEKLLQREQPELTSSATIRRRPPAGTAPLSFAQERLWFLDQLEPGSAVYNTPMGLRLKGALNLSALERALGEIVRRHEMLRTRFAAIEGRPYQIVEPDNCLPLPVMDLRQLPEEQRETEALRLCTEGAGLPFDLAHGPLIRARLLRLGRSDYILLLNLHHIASDGWSMGVLFRELKILYQAFCDNRPSPLPELPIQYADYAVWQRSWLRGEALEQQLDYWKKKLAGAPALLELPADRPRPAMRSYGGAALSGELPPSLLRALGELSRREGTTLFMTLLAAFQCLLHRYTGLEDIVTGSVIAGRNRAQLEGLIGFLVNTLVLRGDLSGNPSFRALLRRTRDTTLEAYDHQDLPFEKLVEALAPGRNLSCAPLFQVMFVLQNAPGGTVNLAGIQATPIELHNGTSKTDLTFFLEECQGALHATMEYSTDLFEPGTIQRMLDHYQKLLEGIVANPACRISDLPLLTESERRQILAEWNHTATEYRCDQCIHELFELQVQKTPEAVALVFENRRMTYRELNHRANQLARYLKAHGVQHGTKVGICVERSLEMVIGLLGILKAGGAYVPLDPAYPALRLQFMLEDTRIPVLLTQERLLDSLPGDPAQVICLDREGGAWAGEKVENPESGAGPESLAYVIYTSGSTGKPNGTCIPHRAVVRLVQNPNYVSLTSDEVFLQFAPISFDASTFEIWGCLLNGGRLVVAPAYAPSLDELGQWIQKGRVTTLWLTAALFQQMVENNLQSLSRVRQLLAGGETLPVAAAQKVVDHLKDCQLVNGYGPTENTTFTCCYPVKGSSWLGTSVPIGRPIANTQVYVLDGKMQPVPVGIRGELCISGDGLAEGYLNRPGLTAERFVSHPFSRQPGARLYRTGDWVRWLPDGNLEFLGRMDNQVKIRGFRIELGEIESALSGHSGVRETVVEVREDVPGDKRLVAYIVNRNGPANSQGLREFLQSKLPGYMVPAAFVTLDCLPLTPNGKVDRKALPRTEFESAMAQYVPPGTATEIALATIWCEVLGLKQIGISDNFFECGGHSLLALRLVSRINRDLKLNLQVRTLFQHPTIRTLATHLPDRTAKERTPELIPLHLGGSGPELFFLIDEGSLGLFKLAHFMGDDLPLFASVVPLAESALKASAKRRLSDLPRMEDMAAEHADLIGSRRATGPLLVAGHCFGGILAFEVAHQLRRRGRQVEAVLMLDTWMAQPKPGWRRNTWIRAHAARLLQQGPGYLWHKSRRRINLEKGRLAETVRLSISPNFSTHVPMGVIERIYRQAMLHYRPRVLSSRGILFVSKEDWLSNAYRQLDNSLGTGRWFGGGVEVMEVPGDHVTLLDERHLPELAACCRNGLQKLRSRPR